MKVKPHKKLKGHFKLKVKTETCKMKLVGKCPQGLEQMAEDVKKLLLPKAPSLNRKATVNCKFCQQETLAQTAHIHENGWVGDECCWDERLRTTA